MLVPGFGSVRGDNPSVESCKTTTHEFKEVIQSIEYFVLVNHIFGESYLEQ